MKEIKHIAFVGSGNVAWHLAPALENTGYKVREVYSRRPENAEALITRLYEASLKTDLDFSDSEIDLIVISVKDDAIEDVATELITGDGMAVVHTSGTQPLSLLGYLATEETGVFYPLQTFRKEKPVDFRDVPICIEAQTEGLLEQLRLMGERISPEVVKMDTPDRKLTHLAAVFACNFTNHFLVIARQLMERRGLEFEYLYPLIRETFTKALETGALGNQTGPAYREDHIIMEEHLSYLQNDEELSHLYEAISEHIIAMKKADEADGGG